MTKKNKNNKKIYKIKTTNNLEINYIFSVITQPLLLF